MKIEKKINQTFNSYYLEMGPDYETLEEICSIYQKSAYEKGLIIKELEQENKMLKEKLSGVTMVSDDEKQSIEHILELEKENKTMKLTLEQMENTCKDYLNDRDTLREENRNLKERVEELEKEIEELNKMMLFETKI